jgi:hypothetical protein
MRKRDLALIFLSIIGIIITLQQEGSISFELVFDEILEENKNEEKPIVIKTEENQKEKFCIKPIVVDLDDDGFKEMIIVNKKTDIKIYSLKELKVKKNLKVLV